MHRIHELYVCYVSQGQHITNVEKEEITVMVGRDQCVVETISEIVITCIAPQRDEPVIESVTVSVINAWPELISML